MIYTELTKKALKLSFEAHKNQVDKSGMPYVIEYFSQNDHDQFLTQNNLIKEYNERKTDAFSIIHMI